MDANELTELSGCRFNDMVEGWKGGGFNNNHYVQIDSAKDSDDIKAFKYLKAKGLVQLIDNRSKWGLTEAGRQTALKLLDM